MSGERGRVLLAVCGGIAAYKACEVLRALQKSGCEVRVTMTEDATRFVGPVTFEALSGAPVATSLYDYPGSAIPHISLAEWADVAVVVPATANVLAKMACGIADDCLTTTLLACACPVLVAPGMNVHMWRNAATQSPLQIETWKQALRGSEEWLIDDYSEVFCCNVEGECVAHLSGLQLLFVAIIRGEYALLADIYRFLLMEVRMGREFYVGSASRRDGEADSRGLFGVARAERDCGAIVVQRTHGIAGAFAQKRGIRVGHGHASRGRQLCGQSGGFDAREWLADGAAGRRAGESSDERVEGRRSRYGVRLARKDDGL